MKFINKSTTISKVNTWENKKKYFEKELNHLNMVLVIDLINKAGYNKKFYASSSHFSLIIETNNEYPPIQDGIVVLARKEGARHYANIKNDYKFEYLQKPHPRKTIKIKECSKEEVENVLIEFLDMLRDSEKE